MKKSNHNKKFVPRGGHAVVNGPGRDVCQSFPGCRRATSWHGAGAGEAAGVDEVQGAGRFADHPPRALGEANLGIV